MRPRRLPPALPAVVGAAAALLALSTLGLTWVSRQVEGPLGDAGETQVEQLAGRDVAPVVAALVPGATAAVVLALLLTGWWRATALLVGALAALGAAWAAAGAVLGTQPEGSTTTGVPLLAVAACLLAGASALAGAVAAARGARAARRARSAGGAGARAAAAGGAVAGAGAGDGRAAGGGRDRGVAPTVGTTAEAEPRQDDLWRALDDGRDPT